MAGGASHDLKHLFAGVRLVGIDDEFLTVQRDHRLAAEAVERARRDLLAGTPGRLPTSTSSSLPPPA